MWYYTINGQSTGPAEEGVLQELINKGVVTRQTYVWREGMAGWVCAGDTPLESLFRSSPLRLREKVLPAGPPIPRPVEPAIRQPVVSAEFKDPTFLTFSLQFLLAATLLVSLLTLWSNWSEIELLSLPEAEITEDDTNANDARQLFMGLLQIGFALPTAVFFLTWIHRACRNAHALGAVNLTYTPGWSVGWYFIPLFNLWKPYEAMKEIWQASKNPRGWQNESTPALVVSWWLLWIGSNLLGQYVMRATWRASTSQESLQASFAGFFVDLLDIPLCIVAFLMIGAIRRFQLEKLEG